jgi:hypothetical protein
MLFSSSVAYPPPPPLPCCAIKWACCLSPIVMSYHSVHWEQIRTFSKMKLSYSFLSWYCTVYIKLGERTYKLGERKLGEWTYKLGERKLGEWTYKLGERKLGEWHSSRMDSRRYFQWGSRNKTRCDTHARDDHDDTHSLYTCDDHSTQPAQPRARPFCSARKGTLPITYTKT